MSLWRVKKETPSSQLGRWMEFYKLKGQHPTQDQLYLAAIRATIATLFAPADTAIDLYDYTLKFTSVSKKNENVHQERMRELLKQYGKKPEDFLNNPQALLDFYKTLDYKKNPVPKEKLNQFEIWKIEERKSQIYGLQSRAKRRRPDQMGSNGKVIRPPGRRRPAEIFERLDSLIDSFPVQLEEPPAAPTTGIPK